MLTKPQGSGAVPGRWTEPVPRVCLPLGEEFYYTQECQGMWSPQVASSIAGKAMEKNVPLSFFFFVSLLYPVYATNKFNFQELE